MCSVWLAIERRTRITHGGLNEVLHIILGQQQVPAQRAAVCYHTTPQEMQERSVAAMAWLRLRLAHLTALRGAVPSLATSRTTADVQALNPDSKTLMAAYLTALRGAASSLATSRTTAAPSSMKAAAVWLSGAATTSGRPPT